MNWVVPVVLNTLLQGFGRVWNERFDWEQGLVDRKQIILFVDIRKSFSKIFLAAIMISEQKFVSQELRSASFRNGLCIDRDVFNLLEHFSLSIPRRKLNRDVYDLPANILECFSLIFLTAMREEYFRKAFKTRSMQSSFRKIQTFN